MLHRGIDKDFYLPRFKHQRLKDNNRNPRLVTIQPPTWDYLIRCSVEEELDKITDFEALSYTWYIDRDTGSPTEGRMRTIICNGKTLKVHQNLHNALFQLRSLNRGTSIWIDAICIDQANSKDMSDDEKKKRKAEKSAQVSNMESIFGSAKTVVVWLGRCSLLSGIAASKENGVLARRSRTPYNKTTTEPNQRREVRIFLLDRSAWHSAVLDVHTTPDKNSKPVRHVRSKTLFWRYEDGKLLKPTTSSSRSSQYPRRLGIKWTTVDASLTSTAIAPHKCSKVQLVFTYFLLLDSYETGVRVTLDFPSPLLKKLMKGVDLIQGLPSWVLDLITETRPLPFRDILWHDENKHFDCPKPSGSMEAKFSFHHGGRSLRVKAAVLDVIEHVGDCIDVKDIGNTYWTLLNLPHPR
ncbi:heterokaryon incompatibility protein-domain-containing protein [Bipolaris maydis]|nr:heterokaryon incompatibility protein-domain-containing protein [Bipolaris maydis]